jgi:hypothetical protein
VIYGRLDCASTVFFLALSGISGVTIPKFYSHNAQKEQKKQTKTNNQKEKSRIVC